MALVIKELKSILGKGIRIIVVGAFTMFVLGQVLARPLARCLSGMIRNYST